MDGSGYGSVEVAGRDVASHLVGLELHAKAGEPMHVILHADSKHGALFEGLAHVEVVVHEEQMDPGPAAAQFLSAMDPKTLEQAVLRRLDLPDMTMMEAVLKQLVEWANGN